MISREIATFETDTVERDAYRTIEKVFLLLRDIFIMVTLLFFLLRLDAYLYNQKLLPVAPIFLVAVWIAAVGSIGMASSLFERHYLASFTRCLPIILPFLAIAALSWLGIFGEQAYYADNYKYLLLPSLDFGLFLTGILIGVMNMRKGMLSLGMTIALVVIITTSFIDILYPGTFSRVGSRAAGIFEDPNTAAFSMVLFTAVLLRWNRKALNLPDLLLFTLCGAAVFFTFSRGGAVQFAVLAFLYWLNMTTRQRFYSVMQLVIFIILLAAGISYLLPDYTGQLKILEFNTVRGGWFFGNFGGAFSTQDARFDLIMEAIGLISSSPILGLGTGYVGSMSPYGPHNMYLARWIDNGVFGMLFYVWLLGAAFIMNKINGNLGGAAAVVIIMLYSLVSHTALDDRVIILVMAIVTARAIVNPASHNEKSGKTL